MNWFIIVFFIIAITIFLITKYYHLKKTLEIEEIESFENENILTPSEKLFKYHGIKIKYLNANQASNLIVKDGEYLQGMNQANLSARGCDSIDDLYNKYKDAFDDITEKEKLTIDKFILKNNLLSISPGFYRVKITCDNADVRKCFNFSKNHIYYSHYFKFAYNELKDKFNMKFELILDGEPNAYVYEYKDFVKSKSIFRYWYDDIVSLKKQLPKNILVKMISSDFFAFKYF